MALPSFDELVEESPALPAFDSLVEVETAPLPKFEDLREEKAAATPAQQRAVEQAMTTLDVVTLPQRLDWSDANAGAWAERLYNVDLERTLLRPKLDKGPAAFAGEGGTEREVVGDTLGRYETAKTRMGELESERKSLAGKLQSVKEVGQLPEFPSFAEWIQTQEPPGAVATALSQFSASIMDQIGGAVRSVAPSLGENADDFANDMTRAAADDRFWASLNKSTTGAIARGTGTVGGLVLGSPQGKTGAVVTALRAAAETHSAALGQGLSKAEADREAAKTFPLMLGYLVTGQLAARGAGALTGPAAAPITRAAAGTGGALAANVGTSAGMAAAQGQPYGVENLTADVLFAGVHGAGVFRDASAHYDPETNIVRTPEGPLRPDGMPLMPAEQVAAVALHGPSALEPTSRQAEGMASRASETPQPITRELGPGAANIEEFSPQRSIGAYNADVDARRVARGLQPLMSEARKGDETTWSQAEQRIEADPGYPRNLVEDIQGGKKPSVSDVEQDALLWHMIDLQNKKAQAEIRAIDDASYSVEERAEFSAEAQRFEEQLQRAEEANRKAGTASGRALRIRRQLANEDFTLAGMLRRAELSKGDKLTPDETKKIQRQSEKIQETEQQFEARVEEATGEQRVSSRIRKKPQKGLVDVEAERGNLTDAIAREKAAGRQVTDLRSWIQRLAENFVRSGIKQRDPLVKAVHEQVAEIFPELTERQTRDLISGYGDFKPLNKEQVKTELRDIKGQLQNVSKLEDVIGREPLKKSGVERRTPSDEERRLIQQVNEAKRRYGVVVTDPAQQLKSALDSRKTYYRNRMSDLQAEIDARQRNVKSATRSPSDAALEQLKAEYANVKMDHDAIFNTDEIKTQKQLNAYKSALERRSKDLQQRLERGDFEKTERRQVDISKDPEAVRLKSENESLRREFNQQREKWLLAQRSAARKFLDATADILGSSRTLITSADVSAPFRQGAFVSLGDLVFNPKRFVRQFGSMFRALGSEKQFQRTETALRLRPNADLYEKSGLHLSDIDGKFTQREETMRSNLAEKVPLVRRSNRAYADFLNQQRADTFDSFVEMMGGRDRVAPEQAEYLASSINEMTGRGGISGKHVGAANFLARFLFSPRFLISRFKMLVGEPIWRGMLTGPKVGAKARGIVALQYGKFTAGLAALYGLAKLAGASIDTDRRSTDFGKIRFGNTRLDPMGGLQQLAVLLSRGQTGKVKTTKGDVKPVTASALGNFLRGKLAPIPGAAVDLTFGGGKNVIGEPVTPLSTLKRLTVPISYEDAPAVMREHGPVKGTVLEILNLMGMGLQHHGKRPGQ